MANRTKLGAGLAALVLLSSAIAGAAAGRTITVDDDGPADYNNIQAAINAAGNGDTVVVLPGVYTGPGNRDIDFLGKAITVQSIDPRNPQVVAATIVDCNASYSDRHRGFYFHNQEGPDSVLNGLTVTGDLQLTAAAA
ncbi:MAG TPA: hypothetical protein VMW16_15940 [Sedimentisphaerales bacterium]|nr:hypothetical protein [Sedimentisphaerales bacterium]